MSLHFDALETRFREEREHDLFSRLPVFLRTAVLRVPGLTAWLEGIDPRKDNIARRSCWAAPFCASPN